MTRRTQVAQLGQFSDARELFERSNQTGHAIGELQEIPILNGVLLEDVTIENSGNSIAHGLGREPRGWLVAGVPNGVVIEEQATQTDLKRHLDLQIKNVVHEDGAGNFMVNEGIVTLSHMSGAGGRIEIDNSNARTMCDFPGPNGASISKVEVFGENPSANVRGVTNTLRQSTDVYFTSVSELETDTPAVTLSLQWTSTFDTSDTNLPLLVNAGERNFIRCQGVAGSGTNVHIYGVRWTYALAATTVVDLWVF